MTGSHLPPFQSRQLNSQTVEAGVPFAIPITGGLNCLNPGILENHVEFAEIQRGAKSVDPYFGVLPSMMSHRRAMFVLFLYLTGILVLFGVTVSLF